MTNAIQVSGKVGDSIFVVGGETPEAFASNCTIILGEEGFSDVKEMFNMAIVGAAVQAAVERRAIDNLAGPIVTPPQETGGGWGPGTQGAAAQAPPQTSQGPLEETDKWGNHFTYNVPGAPNCPHGTRVLKAGISQKGSAYKGWACPTQAPSAYRNGIQADKSCKMEFVNDR